MGRQYATETGGQVNTEFSDQYAAESTGQIEAKMGDQVRRKIQPYDHLVLSTNPLYLFPFTYHSHVDLGSHSLKRMELGQDSVQGTDYAYTIKACPEHSEGARLKGINMPSLNPDHACPERKRGNPGGDGAATGPNTGFARDAFGMILGYHEQDFVKSGSVYDSSHSTTSSWHVPNPTFLYNGNLVPSVCEGSSSWAWNSRRASGATDTAMASVYHYDLLNRIRTDSTRLRGAKAWSSVGSHWQSVYTYDGNGNILSLQRHDGSNGLFDNLTYNYYTTSPKSNRLEYIGDNPTVSHPNDIEDQPAGNYQYDAIGNLIADDEGDVTAIFWTPANKIDSIVTATAEIGYLYDAAGNRVRKQVWDGSTLTSVTWYVRDPQGNALSIYTRQGASGDVHLSEVPLYGSDRLGMIRPDIEYNDDQHDTINRSFSRIAEQWNYELKDHLGNIRVVIGDEVQEPTAGVFLPIVASRVDYYPFGMTMEGREENQVGYRYGYNGKENDNDVKGTGNSVDYGARMYDARVARWLSLDPLMLKYPGLSPYHFTADNPVLYVDQDGRDYSVYINHRTNTITIKATYHVVGGGVDAKMATIGVRLWNDQNGRFKYVVGEGSNAKEYEIEFALEVKKYATEAERDAAFAADKSGEGNKFRVVDKLPFSYGLTRPGDEGGINSIEVENTDEARIRNTQAHEIGHTIVGFRHWTRGLMKKDRDPNDSDAFEVTVGYMTKILQHAQFGSSSKVPSGDRLIGTPSTTPKVEVKTTGVPPSDFIRGSVQETTSSNED